MIIRSANPADAPAIAAIYNHYVVNTIITFEEEPIATTEMARRIEEVLEASCWFVGVEHDQIVGYAYAGQWKSRCAYRYSVESTVYLEKGATGRGFGSQLYAALIADLRERGLHGVIGGVALPNAASVALHEKLGFQKVAHFKEVGWKFKQWIDVGYWELIL